MGDGSSGFDTVDNRPYFDLRGLSIRSNPIKLRVLANRRFLGIELESDCKCVRRAPRYRPGTSQNQEVLLAPV